MVYVALLRGINVGGKNKIDMKCLRLVFEMVGMRSVRTYINSGNVLFEHDAQKDAVLTVMLERAIEKAVGFHVSVLVKSASELKTVIAAVPSNWCNDRTMKCDVVFLWDGSDVTMALSQLRIQEGIDEVRTVLGVIVWKVDRVNAGKSGLLKLTGTPLYKQVTIRNINTVRKLLDLMKAIGV